MVVCFREVPNIRTGFIEPAYSQVGIGEGKKIFCVAQKAVKGTLVRFFLGHFKVQLGITYAELEWFVPRISNYSVLERSVRPVSQCGAIGRLGGYWMQYILVWVR